MTLLVKPADKTGYYNVSVELRVAVYITVYSVIILIRNLSK